MSTTKEVLLVPMQLGIIIHMRRIEPLKLFFRGNIDHDDFLVALHNKNSFYQRDMRKDFQVLSPSPGKHYYVDYQVKFAIERVNKENNQPTCQKNYNFDMECVYNKFQSIRLNTSTDCTVPWNINNSNICRYFISIKWVKVCSYRKRKGFFF